MNEQETMDMPFLSNVGLMLTYKCTIACPHCIVQAGPDRKEEMSLEAACAWLDQIRAYHNGVVRGISLTGGEPFYNIQKLVQIADHANQLGLIVSVVSNAYWASTPERALEILARCSSIQMLSVSADIHHQELIPLQNVKNAVWAAKKLDKLYNIAVTTENMESQEYLDLMDRLLEFTDKDFVNTAIALPIGRAQETIDPASYRLCAEPTEAACSMVSYPIVFPNGNVIACIGPPITFTEAHPLNLGNLNQENLQQIFTRAEQNHLLHAIRVFGPKVLVRALREHGFGHLLPGPFIEDSTCDVCAKLFSKREICDALNEIIAHDEKLREMTAYGRVYYLNEAQMIAVGAGNDAQP